MCSRYCLKKMARIVEIGRIPHYARTNFKCAEISGEAACLEIQARLPCYTFIARDENS